MAEELETLKLSTGKTVGLRTPNGSSYLAAFRLAGQDLTLVPVYQALFCVGTIDGEQVSRPISLNKMDALADRLTVAGVQEVQVWFNRKSNPELVAIMEEHPEMPPEEAAQLADVRRSEKLKNLLVTQ